MKTLSYIVLAAIFVVSTAIGCANSKNSPHQLIQPFATSETTPGGIAIEATPEIIGSEDFPQALLEVDAVARGFATGLHPYQYTLRGVRLTPEPDGEVGPHDMTTHYIGDGVIEVHFQQRHRPIVHCLIGGFVGMARAQNPGILEWYLNSGTIHAQLELMKMYPEYRPTID